MLELLAAIQSVDPPSFVLWGLFLFAAGMYPVGIMLGSSCSACCETPPCSACTEGQLPDTVTVTFDGFTNQTPGPDLISLGISACFGGGASARVTAPGGNPETDKGPISAVTLTSGGSGYAKLGRVAPTLTVSGGSGTGATFTPTLTSANDACGVPTWKLASAAFKGGTGYLDGESLTITVAEGDTEVSAATAVVNTTRTQPTLSASVSGGSGAAFSVTTAANPGSPATWGVASVSVTNGGTGYADGTAVDFSGGADLVVASEASAVIRTGRSVPTVEAFTIGSGGGESLSPVLTKATGWDGRDYWTVSSITINSGGTGHAEYDAVTIGVTTGTEGPYSYFSAYISQVDANGAIVAIQVDYGGEYWVDTGVIESVELWDGGSYYDDDGIPTGVTVTNGGQYYREDAGEPPYVASVTVSVASQALPSDGTGATFTATVEDDPESPDFGKITGIAIVDGGSGYLAWKWRNTKCCGDYYNGLSVVLKRGGPATISNCEYSHIMCGVGNMNLGLGRILFKYFGPSIPPTVQVISENLREFPNSIICDTLLTASGSVTDCSSISGLVLSSAGGATATITAGGDYDAAFRNPGFPSCFICCKGHEQMAGEIEIDITADDDSPGQGVYVRPLVDFLGPPGQESAFWGNYYSGGGLGIAVQLGLCSGGQTRTEFFTDDPSCDTCHKKCAVDVTFFPQGIFSAFRNQRASCDCEDTPLCNPYGTYTLCNLYSTTSCPYQVEIRAPL